MECLRDNKRDDHRNKHSICPLLPPNGDFLLIRQVVLAAIRRVRIILLILRVFQYHALECEARIFPIIEENRYLSYSKGNQRVRKSNDNQGD